MAAAAAAPLCTWPFSSAGTRFTCSAMTITRTTAGISTNTTSRATTRSSTTIPCAASSTSAARIGFRKSTTAIRARACGASRSRTSTRSSRTPRRGRRRRKDALTSASRITQVIGGLGGGGAERVCVNLANAWAGGGRAVTVLTKSEETSAYALDARVNRRAFGRSRAEALGAESVAAVLRALGDVGCSDLLDNAAIISLMRDAILATRPDVVVSHMDVTNVRVLAAMHGSGVPVVACEHTDVARVPAGRWTHARDVLYREAAAVVTTHPAIAEFLARRGAPAVAIANPLVPPVARAAPPGPRRRLVALARFSIEKRSEMTVRAFEKIA